MPRYVIERNFAHVTDDDMAELAVKSKRVIAESFPAITWEHSHIVTDDEGVVRSFCVYGAPDEATVREHAEQLGGHVVERLYEIVGDVEPGDISA